MWQIGRRQAFRICAYICSGFLILCTIGAIWGGWKLYASLPKLEGEYFLDGLEYPVTVNFDEYGIPTISAESRFDAFKALGYVTAQDRLFQMDLMRRKASGRLSEILGSSTRNFDRQQRIIGFNRICKSISQNLPPDQRSLLQAYADGVNAFLENVENHSFEFVLLDYYPERWTIEDSVLIMLNMFQALSWSERSERMMTVLEDTLPPDVPAFLTPDEDMYSTVLIGGNQSHRPIKPIPVEQLASVLNMVKQVFPDSVDFVQTNNMAIGSNSWAISGARTVDGRAILANDMHLNLQVPNIWYRAVLHYQDVQLSGVMIPGIPAVIVGSNGRVAWGITNAFADCLDLVLLQINPDNPEEYRTQKGWRKFETVNEKITIKKKKEIVERVQLSVWGPVIQNRLKGYPVAVRWTALDAKAVDLGLMQIDKASSLEDAVKIMNRFGCMPLNVVLADRDGRIAWTYAGKIPIRQGFDGTTSQFWYEQDIGWNGYIPPDELPRLIDPPSGIVVSANNRSVGREYPYRLGANFASGYRAWQIMQKLLSISGATESDMFALQLDTTSEFYRFYQKLALDTIKEKVPLGDREWKNIRDIIEQWNGQAGIQSRGFGILVRFRQTLLQDVFEPLLQRCVEADPAFVYAWQNAETPLRVLLKKQIPEILPDPNAYTDWPSFILSKLEKSVRQLKTEYNIQDVAHLPWGKMNKARISHPLSRGIPIFGEFLNMPRDELPGCTYCIRVSKKTAGASQRMVISPAHPEHGILQMPGGQSGHPLSPHYKDQHPYWVNGKPLPFLSKVSQRTVVLMPEAGF